MFPDYMSYLQFDSEFFGIPIARLENKPISNEAIHAALEQTKQKGIRCIYALSDCSHTDRIRLLELCNFNLIDIRITLESKIHQTTVSYIPSTSTVRLATADDITTLRPIAASNHNDSRFYHDGHFPKERCDELYALWIEKSCLGYADAVLVPDNNGKAIGYLSCHITPERTGQIGLVGIHPDFHGKGHGKTLIKEALSWFASNGIAKVTVVTQGCNTGAQRLYQKNGFVTSSVEVWHHYWKADR